MTTSLMHVSNVTKIGTRIARYKNVTQLKEKLFGRSYPRQLLCVDEKFFDVISSKYPRYFC